MHLGNTKKHNTTQQKNKVEFKPPSLLIYKMLAVHRVRVPSSKFSSLTMCHNVAKSSL